MHLPHVIDSLFTIKDLGVHLSLQRTMVRADTILKKRLVVLEPTVWVANEVGTCSAEGGQNGIH